MSDAITAFEANPFLSEPELPAAVADSIASWRRTFARARPENVRGILHNAASDLLRTRKVGKTVWPEADALVAQEIADALADMAQTAGIDDDDAQLIFAQAQRDEAAEQVNGHDAAPDEPPPASSPDEYGVPAVVAEKPPPEPATFTTPSLWPQEAPPPVDWVVTGRIPRGDVTTLHGDGGAGKTDVALQLAANCARGAALALRSHRNAALQINFTPARPSLAVPHVSKYLQWRRALWS